MGGLKDRKYVNDMSATVLFGTNSTFFTIYF